jgi:hypothetical protein
MRLKLFTYAFLIPALIGLFPGSSCNADSDSGERFIYTGEPSMPMLGKTLVIPTKFMPDPFINTSAQVSLGYGKSSGIETPILEIGGETILGLEGDLLFALLIFDYRYAVQDWLGVWIEIRAAARLGNELQSILAQGVNAYTGFSLGWLFRLKQTDRYLLSTSLMVSNGSTTIVDILGFVEDIIDGAGHYSIVRTVPTLGTIGDLRYAYAANDYISLQVRGSAAYAESIERDKGNDWYYSIAGTVGFDLMPRVRVPLGTVLGFKHNTIPEGGEDIVGDSQSFLLNLSYTGRPDFSIGLDIEYHLITVKSLKDKVKYTSAVITMQYFF